MKDIAQEERKIYALFDNDTICLLYTSDAADE